MLHAQLRLHQIQYVGKRIVRIVGVTNKAPSHLRMLIVSTFKTFIILLLTCKTIADYSLYFPGFYTATLSHFSETTSMWNWHFAVRWSRVLAVRSKTASELPECKELIFTIVHWSNGLKSMLGIWIRISFGWIRILEGAEAVRFSASESNWNPSLEKAAGSENLILHL
jgi:hypothetical protein